MQLGNWKSLSRDNIEKLKIWCRSQNKYNLENVDPKRICIDLALEIKDAIKLLQSVVEEGYGSEYIEIECPSYGCENIIQVEKSLITEKAKCIACGEVFTPNKYLLKSTFDNIFFSIDPNFYKSQDNFVYGIDETNNNKKENVNKIINLKNNSPSIPMEKEKEEKMKKIFLSHSSKNSTINEAFYDLLKEIGLKNEQIFYSSNETTGVDYFDNCLESIKKEFNENDLLVIFMLSNEFYSSDICMAEIGATWVSTNKYIPIILPPLNYSNIKGVVDPMKNSILLSDEKLSIRLDKLKEKIEQFIGIEEKVELPDWTKAKEKFKTTIQETIEQIHEIDQRIESIKIIDNKIIFRIELQNNSYHRYQFDELNITLITKNKDIIKEKIDDWSIQSVILKEMEKISFYVNVENKANLKMSQLDQKSCSIKMEYYETP